MKETLHTTQKDKLEKLEIKLLLEDLYKYYGFDFRDYSPGTLKHRMKLPAYKAGHLEKIFAQEGIFNPFLAPTLLAFIIVHRTGYSVGFHKNHHNRNNPDS